MAKRLNRVRGKLAIVEDVGQTDRGHNRRLRIERLVGPATKLLSRASPDRLASMVVQVYALSRSALILGSGQQEAIVDEAAAQAAEVDVVRRHSGGGAVLLTPRRSLWIDVSIPRDDPRWSDDVVTSALWLGEAWTAALRNLGVSSTVHRTRLQKTHWGSLVCFGALGPGEVVVAGRKVVGMSQRRTRTGARFQCLVLQHWDPAALLNLLQLEPSVRARALADLAGVAAGPGVPLAEVEQALLAQL